MQLDTSRSGGRVARGSTVAAQLADVTQPNGAGGSGSGRRRGVRIDVLVNNVGGVGGGPRIADGTDEDWRAAIGVNLIQTVRMTRLALPHMKGRAGPSVVNVASISG
jgi:NAD(P)-dependent dehydrogenase (short-subunit alcohol dehydrogenase family)